MFCPTNRKAQNKSSELCDLVQNVVLTIFYIKFRNFFVTGPIAAPSPLIFPLKVLWVAQHGPLLACADTLNNLSLKFLWVAQHGPLLACADTLNNHGWISVGVFKRPFRFDSMLHMYLQYLFSFHF